MEEVEEFCDVKIVEEVVFEVVDFIYFVMVRVVVVGVFFVDVEKSFDVKSFKVKRR